MRKVKRCLLWALLFLCCVLSFWIANEINLLNKTVSLRYASPLSEQQVSNALDFASTDSNKENISPTFWLEKDGLVTAQNSSVQTSNITYLGNPEYAYYAKFTSGFYPISDDSGGCAVSDTLAYKLWGSLDIVGQTLLFDEQSYTVRGIFADKGDVILTRGDTDTGFTNVEIYSEHNDNIYQAAKSFAVLGGLGEPNQIADGIFIAGIASAVCYLPIGIAFIILFIKLFKICRSYNKNVQYLIWFILAVTVALLLPYWLSKIPQGLIPSMWSDFSFWGSLLQTTKVRIEEWLSLVSTAKDIHVKFLLLFQAGIVFVEILTTIILKYNSYSQDNF